MSILGANKKYESLNSFQQCRRSTPPPVRGRVHASIQTDGTVDDIFGEDQTYLVHLLTDEEAKRPLHLEGAATDVVSLLNDQENEGRIKVPEQESGNSNHQGSEVILLIQSFARKVCDDSKKTAIENYLHSGCCSDPG